MSQNKARIGSIGEHMVAAQLMQQGWDAFNANSSVTNQQHYDLICINDKLQTTLIQVKTTIKTNFPVGLTTGQAKDRKLIENHVVGPWVFVKASDCKENTEFTYYILTRKQVIELIFQSNDWYLHQLKHDVKESGTCTVREEWLEGKDFQAKKLEGSIGANPLKGTETKGNWDNIWKA